MRGKVKVARVQGRMSLSMTHLLKDGSTATHMMTRHMLKWTI